MTAKTFARAMAAAIGFLVASTSSSHAGPIDPTLPEVAAAIAKIRVTLASVRREQPQLVELAALREAPRQCAPASWRRRWAGDGARRRRGLPGGVFRAPARAHCGSWAETS
jgi:peptidoglycan/xylan/chitin deacetylase (PgdA/CDA1 family)